MATGAGMQSAFAYRKGKAGGFKKLLNTNNGEAGYLLWQPFWLALPVVVVVEDINVTYLAPTITSSSIIGTLHTKNIIGVIVENNSI